jgi:hypothetical protein
MVSKSTLYPSGSVFNVDVLKGVRPGREDRAPNDQSFDLAVIEFNDDGTFVDSSQVAAAAGCVSEARRSNGNGAVVVLFIHGWHHGAAWNVARDDDTHFLAFRDVLMGLALREAERYAPGPLGRRVVGVYLGWNGDPASSWMRDTRWLTHLSFWDRYRTAKKIGDGEAIRDTIRILVARTKDPVELSPGQLEPESPLILVGHSMGALMLESAFLRLLEDEGDPLVRRQTGQQPGPVEIRRGVELVSFPDLLLALNSAADSDIAKGIRAALEQQKLTKTAAADDIRYSPPLFISVTSTADSDTGSIWRWAQFPRVWRTTDGHDSSLLTHTFETGQARVACEPRGFVDHGQNWHCLRPPIPPNKPTPEFAIDLPVRDRQGLEDRPDHNRYRLAPLDDGAEAQLVWIFQSPPEIIADHNDIFNSRSSSLILGLIQISGAVMSLAADWKQTFE